jgi:tetratricopeptide (TPR) repeat protein
MARHLLKLSGISFAVGAVMAPSLAMAQVRGAPDPNATRLMVSVFRTTDKGLGAQAADAMRSRMRSDFPWKQVYVLPKEDMSAVLEASGFPTSEALEPHDEKALAGNLRVDEYVVGNAVKTPTGFRLEPMLVLTRDNSLVQPLGVHEGATLTAAATSASRELREARKQIEPELRCIRAAREEKYDEAKKAAREGIAAYPKATLARICLANVMVSQKSPADSLMTISREIVALDPRSKPGLRLMAHAYNEMDMGDSVVVTLARLLQTDPKNGAMVTEIVEQIANTANPRVARPIIDAAVAENPSDPDLLRLRWRILLAVRDYKEAFAAGEELISLDTANADTTYFMTTTLAYVRDSQPQKAAEVASRGVAKFPDNGNLIYAQVNALRAAGQPQQALEVLDRARQANVTVDDAAVLRLYLLRDLGRAEEVLPAARAAIAAGDTTAAIRGMVINVANDQRAKGAANKSIPELEVALRTSLYADSIASTPELKTQAQFILGAVYATLGQFKLVQANEQKSCPMTKEANDMLVEAQIMLPRGGEFAPDAMRQLMTSVMTLMPTADQMLKAYCR